eukprot:scaffold768_cov166-Amphora_coffeaeformis.AAC.2
MKYHRIQWGLESNWRPTAKFDCRATGQLRERTCHPCPIQSHDKIAPHWPPRHDSQFHGTEFLRHPRKYSSTIVRRPPLGSRFLQNDRRPPQCWSARQSLDRRFFARTVSVT